MRRASASLRSATVLGSMFVLTALIVGARPTADSEHPDEILVGMSTALSGPAARLGINVRAGVLAALEDANARGGIDGRRLRLVSLDDGYEPTRTAPNMRKLVDEDQVLAVIGNVGTPTAIASVPIATRTRTPFIGAYTGAGLLRRTPPDRYVVNFRASYAQETAAMVDALVEHAGIDIERIAFFTQRDGYGDAGYAGGLEALRRHGLASGSDTLHVRYERNTLAVEGAIAELLLSEPAPRAVIMVGAYAPCAVFIQKARAAGLHAVYLNVSFVGSEALAQTLGTDGNDVIITQVVPASSADLPIVKEYRDAMTRSMPDEELTFGSLEGFVATRLFVRALESIEGKPTREGVIDALEALGTFDIGLGCDLSLGPLDHQACDRVWPTILEGGAAVPFRWEDLGEVLKEDAP